MQVRNFSSLPIPLQDAISAAVRTESVREEIAKYLNDEGLEQILISAAFLFMKNDHKSDEDFLRSMRIQAIESGNSDA